jgi:hypothetical protein
MKKILFLVVILFCAFITPAQVTEKEDALKTQSSDTINGWKKGGTFAVTFSQVSLTNWAAGGQNSLAFNGLVNAFANLKHKKSSWDNTLDIGYGLIRQGNKKAPYQKSDDKFEFNSKYGQKASKSWYYAALINFKTQLAPGYNYPNDSVIISNFLAPAYLLGALGMDFKPNNSFTCFIAPVTGKVIMVNNTDLANAGNFGVDPAVRDDSGNVITPGKKTKLEFGGYLRISYRKDIMENINLTTKADFFSNYMQDPQNIVVNWETLISMKINKYISATLSNQLIYDDKVKIKINDQGDQGPRTQFKELFGLGFSYKF